MNKTEVSIIIPEYCDAQNIGDVVTNIKNLLKRNSYLC